jgi:hypothetical protein
VQYGPGNNRDRSNIFTFSIGNVIIIHLTARLNKVCGICIFAPIVNAETAEEWNEKGINFGMSGEYEER